MLERLQSILQNYLDDKSIILKEEMLLIQDFDMDSYEIIMIMSEIEEEFGIEIPDRAITKIKTVKDLIDFLENAD